MSKSKRSFLKWATRFEKTSCEKGMVGWLIKKRIVKTKFMGNALLVMISIFFFSMSPLVFVIV